MRVREIHPSDLPAVLHICNTCNREKVTLEDLRSTYEALRPGGRNPGIWYVAERPATDSDSRAGGDKCAVKDAPATCDETTSCISGYGLCYHLGAATPGSMQMNIAVKPEFRNRGAGTAIYSALLAWAKAEGGTGIFSQCYGDEEASRLWAEKRGFRVDRTRIESTLDLSTWDERKTRAFAAGLEDQGIVARVLCDPLDDSDCRLIYAVTAQTQVDAPGQVSRPQDFSTWLAQYRERLWRRLHVLGLDGAEPVGVSSLLLPSGGSTEAFTMFTGVLREYRGKGLGTALKALAIDAARKAGALTVRTYNDDQNVAALRINRKMGYTFRPGYMRLHKTL